MISSIINFEVGVNSRNQRPRLITLTETLISNGNRTEWSPIRSVIIRVVTKSDDRAAGKQNLTSELVENRSFLNQSQSRKL